jgi:hypothetical protein
VIREAIEHKLINILDIADLADDETAKYPKRFLLLGLILFKNILPTLSVDHPEGSSSSMMVLEGKLTDPAVSYT